MQIVVNYWLCGKNKLNFGEHFARIIPELMGCDIVEYNPLHKYDECLLLIGTWFHSEHLNPFLNNTKKLKIWGLGSPYGEDNPFNCKASPYNERLEIYSVRGNLTKKLGNVPEYIPTGDPMFVMSKLKPMKYVAGDRIIYAPHWENRHDIVNRLNRIGANDFFDVFIEKEDIQREVDRLLSAKFVLANALHLLIFCLTYNIPCAPLLLEEETLNFPTKWQDVFDWLGIPLTFVKSYNEGLSWWNSTGKHIEIPDITPVLENFPFRAS